MTVVMMTTWAVCDSIKMMLSGQSEHTIIRITGTGLLLLFSFIASLESNFIQMKTLLLWIFGLLFISPTGAHELNGFPKNFVAAKKNETVTLTCGTKPREAITWKFQDDDIEDIEFEENLVLDDQNLIVSEVASPMLGEYSCWRGKEKLSSTYLLLKVEEDEELDSFLSCRAKSYDCTFTCKWTHSGYTAVRLGLGPDCTEGGKSCQWVNSNDQLPGKGFQFELSHSLSPFAEESTMLQLTAEAIADPSFIRKTKSFFLRDIIQPDSPQIVRCEEADQDLNVTIDPPSNWSTPHSYFTLEHEIEYLLKDNGQTGRSSSALIPKRISKLRVRSRDPLVLSPWSQWTPWKNVRNWKKNPCKCKNTATSCCPEFPPGHLDHCNEKKKKKRG